MGFFDTLKKFGGIGSGLMSFGSSVVSLIKIFQRCSAPIVFRAKLSSDTQGTFSWATDIFKTIFKYIVPVNHLNEIEFLTIAGYSFYISFPFLFVSLFKSSGTAYLTLNTAAFITLTGVGIRLVMYGETMGYFFIFNYPCILLFVAVYSFCVSCLSDTSGLLEYTLTAILGVFPAIKDILDVKSFRIVFPREDILIGTLITLFVFSITSFPIFATDYSFIITLFVLYAIIMVITYFISGFFQESFGDYAITGFRMISSLLIIPLINGIVDINRYNDQKHVTDYVTSYIIIVPIFSTFILNTLLIKYDYSPIVSNYKKNRKYYEVFDLAFKYLYAVASNLDPTGWSCIAIEVIILAVIAFAKPFKQRNRYVLDCGECFVIILTNLIAMFYNGMFTLPFIISIIALCILPVIVSLYFFFIYDFGKPQDVEVKANLGVINIVSTFIIIVGSLLYGLSIPMFKVFRSNRDKNSFKY